MTPEARQKAESAGWKFDYTTVLEQTYAHRKKPGKGTELNFEDGVYYSPDEVRTMNREGVKIDRQLHAVKKVFGGVIVEIRPAGTEEAPAEEPKVRQVPLF